MTCVLDTSVVSALMKRDSRALSCLSSVNPLSVVLCTPVAAEILYGLGRLVEGSRRQAMLRAQYSILQKSAVWIDWSVEAASAFAKAKVELQRRGTPVADMDLIISSIALSLRASVATRNVRHFQLVPGLHVEEW